MQWFQIIKDGYPGRKHAVAHDRADDVTERRRANSGSAWRISTRSPSPTARSRSYARCAQVALICHCIFDLDQAMRPARRRPGCVEVVSSNGHCRRRIIRTGSGRRIILVLEHRAAGARRNAAFSSLKSDFAVAGSPTTGRLEVAGAAVRTLHAESEEGRRAEAARPSPVSGANLQWRLRRRLSSHDCQRLFESACPPPALQLDPPATISGSLVSGERIRGCARREDAQAKAAACGRRGHLVCMIANLVRQFAA